MDHWLLMPMGYAWIFPVTWALVACALVWWWWPRESANRTASASEDFSARHRTRLCRRVLGPAGLPWSVAGVVTVLAVWPHGGWSGYAALAFQSPSLLSVTWAVVVLLQAVGWLVPTSDDARPPAVAWVLLCALGWLLVIDTLNLWPRGWDIGFYAWGFSAGSLWLSAACILCLAWRHRGVWVWQAIALLAMYALLRWPSGNVWDAWLDPVVWVVAHVKALRHAWHGIVFRIQR